jgi:hypothetical protein
MQSNKIVRASRDPNDPRLSNQISNLKFEISIGKTRLSSFQISIATKQSDSSFLIWNQ